MPYPCSSLRGFRSLVVLGAVAALAVTVAASASAQEPGMAPQCSGPEHRQLDFWLGDWDVYDAGGPDAAVARVQVTSMLDGCAVREVYVQNDGMRGESFSMYDASRRVWHQSWVTTRGDLLLLEGGVVEGRMVLTATETRADGTTGLIRGAWWRDGADVRQLAERSTDGGATWAPAWDIVFRPHPVSGAPPSEQERAPAR